MPNVPHWTRMPVHHTSSPGCSRALTDRSKRHRRRSAPTGRPRARGEGRGLGGRGVDPTTSVKMGLRLNEHDMSCVHMFRIKPGSCNTAFRRIFIDAFLFLTPQRAHRVAQASGIREKSIRRPSTSQDAVLEACRSRRGEVHGIPAGRVRNLHVFLSISVCLCTMTPLRPPGFEVFPRRPPIPARAVMPGGAHCPTPSWAGWLTPGGARAGGDASPPWASLRRRRAAAGVRGWPQRSMSRASSKPEITKQDSWRLLGRTRT